MKTFKATVAVTGTFYVEQTVRAASLNEAKDLFTSGRGRNEDDSYNWNNWEEEDYHIVDGGDGLLIHEIEEDKE